MSEQQPQRGPSLARMFLGVTAFIFAVTLVPIAVGSGVWALALWHGLHLKWGATVVSVMVILGCYVGHLALMARAVRPLEKAGEP